MEPEEAKESGRKSRLTESPAVYRAIIPQSAVPASLSTPALDAAASRLTEAQLEEILQTSIIRLREETEPILKLGYLTTLRACAADLERRIGEATSE